MMYITSKVVLNYTHV